jgi:Outer membrane protein beta-barrel domain
MRLCLLVLALFVTLGGYAFAQDATAVGVKGGAAFAKMTFEKEDSTTSPDNRPGFIGGLFVIWPADQRFALQTEALFSQKGAKFKGLNFSGRTTINYLEVPVLARASSAASSGASFHAFTGPSFAIRLFGDTTSTVQVRQGTDDIDNDIKRFDLGLVAGAGVEFGRFVVDGRYTWGLLDIDKQVDETTIRNRGFAFMTAIRF